MRTAVAFRADICAACRKGIVRGDRIVFAYGRAYHLPCTQVAEARRAA